MITRTFSCFKGLSLDSEHKLWRSGCLTWRHFLIIGSSLFSPAKTVSILAQISAAQIALAARIPDYFLTRLSPGYRLRLFPEFRLGTAFLDIETDSLSPKAAITVIGIWFQNEYHSFVQGRDLDDFLTVWPHIKLLLTFNGKRFDVPIILRTFGLTVAPPQIDLLDEARAHGLVGGLKVIEKTLKISRSAEAQGDGCQAPLLWRQYQIMHDFVSLQHLIAYNRQDVVSLLMLTDYLWERAITDCPFPPALPFQAEAVP